MEKRYRKRDKGLSLVEVVVAIALFAVVVTPLMTTLVQSVRINAKGRELMSYTDTAQTVMEGFTDKYFSSIKSALSLYGTTDMTGANSKNGFSSFLGNFYNLKDNAIEIDESALTSLTQVKNSQITYGGSTYLTVELLDIENDYNDKVIALNGVYAAAVRTKLVAGSADPALYFTRGNNYAFIAYTGVYDKGRYSDIILSIIPMAKDEDDKWFSYEIFLTLYPYEEDTAVEDRMTERPMLTLKSGIRGKYSMAD